MTSRKKDAEQRTKSNLRSSLSIDALVKNLVAINNSQFDSEMNNLVLVFDSQKTDSFLLNDLFQ